MTIHCTEAADGAIWDGESCAAALSTNSPSSREVIEAVEEMNAPRISERRKGPVNWSRKTDALTSL
jgi:hypothetical protein